MSSGVILDELFKRQSPSYAEHKNLGAPVAPAAETRDQTVPHPTADVSCEQCDDESAAENQCELNAASHADDDDDEATANDVGMCDDDELPTDIEELRKATEALRSNLTCRICLDSAVNELFLPCRHLVCCDVCAASVRRCPVCRQRIIGTIKAFTNL